MARSAQTAQKASVRAGSALTLGQEIYACRLSRDHIRVLAGSEARVCLGIVDHRIIVIAAECHRVGQRRSVRTAPGIPPAA